VVRDVPRWLDEKVLQKYWEARCRNYSLKDGRQIRGATLNPRSDGYPDVIENHLSAGTPVPAEIEWVTTDFDRHKHDINLLKDPGGFIIVLKQDAGFPLEQVQIDEADFIQWFRENAEPLCRETVAEVRRISARSQEPQILLFYLGKSRTAERNFQIALHHGVWGFPTNRRGVTRGLPKIQQIKKHDIVVFIRSWAAAPHAKVSGGRLPADRYIGHYEQILGVTVTKGYYNTSSPRLWPDNEYPHRFDFRKEPLFVGNNIPCNPKDLGKALHEILRVLQVNGSVERLDTSMMVKLMSLCTR
jgi:hypothetical protein